jgi:hypothetical protein
VVGVGRAGHEASAVSLQGGGDPVLLEDSTIDLGDPPRPGSAVVLTADPDAGPGSVVVRGNVLGGGRWVLLQNGPGSGRLDVLITGNRFRRGAEEQPLRVSRVAALSDNSYLDGAPLPGS